MEVIYTLNENQLNELVSLYQHEWWTKERSFADTKQCVEASQVLIGLVDDAGSLIAFARVLSDFTFKALIFDVIVSPEHRDKGLGAKLMHHIKGYPKLKAVRHFELYCLPALVSFYQKYGFSTDVAGVTLMRLTNV